MTSQLFPLVLIALVFLVLIVLPQRQRRRLQDQTRAMQASLEVGTPVVLTSGLHGTVASLGENTLDLQIAPGVVVTVARQAVLEVRQPQGAEAEDTAAGGTTTTSARTSRTTKAAAPTSASTSSTPTSSTPMSSGASARGASAGGTPVATPAPRAASDDDPAVAGDASTAGDVSRDDGPADRVR